MKGYVSRLLGARGTRACACCALGALVLAVAPVAGAPPPSEQAALAAVKDVIAAHAHACRVSVQNLSATPLEDPLDPSSTLGWRVDANVAFGTGANRIQSTAAWEVKTGAPVPVSPLAGLIARGCSARDPGSPKTLDDWRGLPYLDYDSGELSVGTSPAWRGSEVDQYGLMWARHCTTGPQAIALTRTLYLPGRPAGAEISLISGTIVPGRNVRDAVRWIELRVNGHVAYHVAGAGAPQRRLPAAALRLFRYGANEVELLAAKGPSAPCNATAKGLHVGVKVELTGLFSSDVGLPATTEFQAPGTARIGDHFYIRVPGQTSAGAINFTVFNNGPAGVPGVAFTVDVSGGARVALVGSVIGGGSSGACRWRDATLDYTEPPPYGVFCPLANLKAGARTQVQMVYRFKPRSLPFGEEQMLLIWEVRSPWNRNGGNEQRTVTFSFCGSQATSAGCAQAP